jgi:CHAT domain-containing protein/tetratricopeptide (TPR) repeat protein
VCASSSLAICAIAVGQAPQHAVRLERGRAIAKSLGPGEHDEFIVELRSGQAAIIAVRQRGIDVVLRVFGPDGHEHSRVDRPNVAWGLETITIVAEAAGPYRLDIAPLLSVGLAGRYRLEVTRIGPVRARDRQRVDAEREVTNAEAARASNDLEECRRAVGGFQGAASIWRELGERYEEGVTLYGLALAYRFLGEHEESLRVLNRTDTLMRQVGDSHGLVMTESGLAWSYLYLDDYEAAASHFRVALSHRAAGDQRGNAADLFGLAWTKLLLEKRAEAVTTFERSLALRRAALDHRGEALTLVGLAAALDRLGQSEEAAHLANQALEIHDGYPDRYGQADALTVSGWALLHSGRMSDALQMFGRAADVRRALADPAGEAAALHGHAAALRKMGDARQALQLTERALMLVESVRAERTDRDLRAAYFASVQQLYELCIDLLLEQYQTTGDLEAARRAFHISERARARSLLDMVGRRSGVRLHARVGERDPRSQRVAGAGGWVEPLSVAEVQRALDADTTMLAYAAGASRSVLWLIGQSQFRVYELAPVADIARKARQLLESIAVPPTSQGPMGQTRSASMSNVSAKASALAQLVFPEGVGQLVRKRIVLVPSGPLQYVPFGLLPMLPRADSRRILLEDHEVVSLPSASVTRGLRRADWRAQPKKAVALFADPVLQPDDARVQRAVATTQSESGARQAETRSDSAHGIAQATLAFPRLFATRWEAREISRLAPVEPMLALDFRASRSTLERLDLSRYQILHFGTHAIVDWQRPTRSGLLLSTVDERGQPIDGFISAPEIFEWPLRADLVVLSGCRTGIGRDIRGEGVMALSRGFLAAGASRLVMSLWSVDDAATADLMVRFYQRMFGPDHLPPAAALRAAQLDMRIHRRWRSPFFWAGFVLQGEWR